MDDAEDRKHDDGDSRNDEEHVEDVVGEELLGGVGAAWALKTTT